MACSAQRELPTIDDCAGQQRKCLPHDAAAMFKTLPALRIFGGRRFGRVPGLDDGDNTPDEMTSSWSPGAGQCFHVGN